METIGGENDHADFDFSSALYTCLRMGQYLDFI